MRFVLNFNVFDAAIKCNSPARRDVCIICRATPRGLVAADGKNVGNEVHNEKLCHMTDMSDMAGATYMIVVAYVTDLMDIARVFMV